MKPTSRTAWLALIVRVALGGWFVTAALSALVLAGAPAQAAEAPPDTVSGKVYLDGNGNGQCDDGEKGLSGIRVTDGVNFASTDAGGAYSIKIEEDYMIPYRPARTVSVCWPTGKWPVGRWWQRLSDITDAKNVSFGLRDDEQKLPFVFLQASDCHSAARKYIDHYAYDAKQMMPAAKFIFNTGDTGCDSLEGVRLVAGHAAAFPIPMFVTPGNHDFVGENGQTPMSQTAAGWGNVTQYINPVRWSFDYAGVHFLSLDYMEKSAKGFACQIPHVAVRFMEQDLASLAKGTRVVLLVHCYDCSPDFYQALHKFKVDQICSGHTHVPYYVRLAGVPAITNYGVGTGVVTADAIDFVERRSITRGDTNDKLLEHFRLYTKVAMEKRRQQQHSVAAKTLHNSTFAIHGSAQADSAEIIAEFVPGSATKAGLRIGTKDPIEITFDGKAVNIAGAPVPFALIPAEMTIPPVLDAATDAPSATGPPRKITADKSVRWHILIDHDRISVVANERFRLTKAVKIDQPAAVTLLAEGGEATFNQLDVWELRTISNPTSRGLYHFPPPAWNWGGSMLLAALLDDKSKDAAEILKRYAADGVTDYDIAP